MRHFDLSEFDSPDQPGSGSNMDKNFLFRLDAARDIADVPFVIISGFRTPEHNEIVGGRSNSSHLTGYAADIRVMTSKAMLSVVKALLAVGFTRIGINNNAVHVDCDPSKPQNVLWDYY